METEEATKPDTITEPTPTPTAETEVDWQAEVDKWKSAARKHEDRAKANYQAAKELDALKASQLTDTEKAVTEAEARGRGAAVLEYGQRLAAAELKAALTGLIADPSGVIEDLNLAKFVTDTGDVDAEAVTALRDKYAQLAKPAAAPNLHQGRQGQPAERDIAAEISAATERRDFLTVIALKREQSEQNKQKA